MDNVERRALLAYSRRQAVNWAKTAHNESQWRDGTDGSTQAQSMAIMWAHVAGALKTGDQYADGVDE